MKYLILLVLLFAIGCEGKHDGEIVRTEDGKYYLLEHNLGRNYFIRPLDTTQFPKK